MKKQFLRVKQLADQTFSRAEKTDVLTEDLLVAEKRVELLRHACHNTTKKVASCLQGTGLDQATFEKRQKKMPEIQLSQSMLEASTALGESSAMGSILEEGGKLQGLLGVELFNYELDVERSVLGPLQAVLDNDIPNIAKLRKQLTKLTLDMDSARTRYHTANRHSQVSTSSSMGNYKVDVIKEELEEASSKVEHCRDTLASEMYALLSRETELTQYIAQLFKFQASYHMNALQTLESFIPIIDQKIDNYQIKPVFGTALEEHLRVTGRHIASVIEICISSLCQYGMDEEGLFRIAGSASKVKKLKSEFDAGIVDIAEFANDPHTVAGALKSYLRQLPEPLMTFTLYDEWMKASRVQDQDKRLQDLWQIVHQLPEVNFNNLRYLMKFLHQLTLHSEVNKMSSQNIAIVIPPNIIWAPLDDGTNMGINMTLASTHSSIVDSLVTYANWFFPGEVEFVTEPSTSKNVIENQESSSDETKITLKEMSEEVQHEVVTETRTYEVVIKDEFSQSQSERKVVSKSERNHSVESETFGQNWLAVNSQEAENSVVLSNSSISFNSSGNKNNPMESPRVPKRMNKKAAPPIPKDAATRQGKVSSLDRSMSNRVSSGNRVLVERAQSYIEKSSSKPPLVRKAESDNATMIPFALEATVISQSHRTHDLRSDSSNLPKNTSFEENFHSVEEVSPKNSYGVGSPIVPALIEKRILRERPSEKPPLPPEKLSQIDSDDQLSSQTEKIAIIREESPVNVESHLHDSSDIVKIDNLSISPEDLLNERPRSINEDDRPERPPRAHSPNIPASSEKQFCTVIKLNGPEDLNSSPSNKVKPVKPPLPASVKPRINSTNVGVHESKNENNL